MRTEDKNKRSAGNRRLVLAPGAADASEGTVYVDDNQAIRFKAAAEKTNAGEKPTVEYKVFTEQQPGAGFWSVAPGCADISEGMVWVAVIRK